MIKIKKLFKNLAMGFIMLLTMLVPILLGAFLFSDTSLNNLTQNVGHDCLAFCIIGLIFVSCVLGPYTTGWLFYGKPNGEKWADFM